MLGRNGIEAVSGRDGWRRSARLGKWRPGNGTSRGRCVLRLARGRVADGCAILGGCSSELARGRLYWIVYLRGVSLFAESVFVGWSKQSRKYSNSSCRSSVAVVFRGPMSLALPFWLRCCSRHALALRARLVQGNFSGRDRSPRSAKVRRQLAGFRRQSPRTWITSWRVTARPLS